MHHSEYIKYLQRKNKNKKNAWDGQENQDMTNTANF